MRVDDDRFINFRSNKHKDDGDAWLIDRMKISYRTKLNRSLIFPLRTIGFAKYIRVSLLIVSHLMTFTINRTYKMQKIEKVGVTYNRGTYDSQA
jgi:hypothetical protein